MKRWVAGSIAGVALGATAWQALAGRARERAMAGFYRSGGPPRRVVIHGRELWLPIIIHRMDGFASLHPASMAAARELMPSEALHPVALPGGRAAVMVTAFRYYEMTDSRPTPPSEPAEPPYAEVALTILATRDGRAPVLSMGLMAMGMAPTEGYVPHMAVTHRLARDGGRDVWGVPKFVADVDFVDDVGSREVHLAEDDVSILTLTVRAGGRPRISAQPSVMYTVLDGQLVELRMPSVFDQRVALGPTRGRLQIGLDGHPVSETLRRLEVPAEPLAVIDAPVIRTMFVPGVVIGKGRRVVDYEGTDRPYGRFTVRHPGTGPIDQTRPLAPHAAWPGSAAPTPSVDATHEPAAVA